MSTTQEVPVFEMKGEMQVSDNLGNRYNGYVMGVRVAKLKAEGSGRTIKEAKREASKAMLVLMGYEVQ